MSSTITPAKKVRPAPVRAASQPAAAQPVRLEIQRPKTDWRTLIAVNFISFLLHAAILGVCAFIVIDRETFEEIFTTLAISDEPKNEPIVEQSPIQPEKLLDQKTDTVVTSNVSDLVADTTALADLDIDDLEPTVVPEDFNIAGPKIKAGDHFGGRTKAARSALVKQFGGNSASEAAVASGLKWLANRQLEDGSWSFDHTVCKTCEENGGCSQPGALRNCHTGATAMALLAFLGGGHTHKSGEYQHVVKKGLDSMIRRGKMTPEGLDLRAENHEGALYVQGLATIALCETAALTKDSRYSKPAQEAVRFIIAAQDRKGGGWRYIPGERGDTSVVGWQIMALKSAQNSKMKIPSVTFKLADKFLDSVQVERGAMYGYTDATASPTMTSVGLLCRMYMGWNQKNTAMRKGVAYLDKIKPSPNNMYYNYYATQVMHHWGGEEWKRWNEVMRDHLVNTQVKDGIEAGSWNITDPHGGAGGRLYQTCLSIMTLEVYYRHLPIYHREKLKVEF